MHDVSYIVGQGHRVPGTSLQRRQPACAKPGLLRVQVGQPAAESGGCS